VQDYIPKRPVEDNWKAPAVKGYCSHLKASFGVDIDEQKLLNAVDELLEEKDDLALKRDELKELARRLRDEARDEVMNEAVMPILTEKNDPVADLLESGVSPEAYIKQVNELFNVKETRVPPGLKKFRIGEAKALETVPMKAWLPHGYGFRVVDEQVLDLYVERWNTRQVLVGEPIRIEWTPHPGEENAVGFKAILR
jgi:hypothetical protein